MFSTVDLNSVFESPFGSGETSTTNLFPGATASFFGGEVAFGSGVAAAGEGVGDAGAMTSGRSCNSRLVFWSKPPVGPRTTVVSLINPIPGTNQRSSATDIT